MFNRYVQKVYEMIGELNGEEEIELLRTCFNRRLEPADAAQVVLNNR